MFCAETSFGLFLTGRRYRAGAMQNCLTEIKHCVLGSPHLSFGSFPCYVAGGNRLILSRPGMWEVAPKILLAGFEFLSLMELTQEKLSRLLGWLDPNPEKAGQAYVRIKADLTRKFTSQSCTFPDRLADITIDRVAGILTQETIDNWEGDKQRFFYRVAYYVVLESRARKVEEVEVSPDLVTPVIDTGAEENTERELDCLDRCIEKLSAMKRELITKYYRGTKAIKIKNRKELARKLNLELPRLRVQALRIRKELKICIEECLGVNTTREV